MRIPLNILFLLIISIRRSKAIISWGWGFIGGPITTEEDPLSEEEYPSGYHSADTTIISDSEDDLFFLDGELATTFHCK